MPSCKTINKRIDRHRTVLRVHSFINVHPAKVTATPKEEQLVVLCCCAAHECSDRAAGTLVDMIRVQSTTYYSFFLLQFSVLSSVYANRSLSDVALRMRLVFPLIACYVSTLRTNALLRCCGSLLHKTHGGFSFALSVDCDAKQQGDFVILLDLIFVSKNPLGHPIHLGGIQIRIHTTSGSGGLIFS